MRGEARRQLWSSQSVTKVGREESSKDKDDVEEGIQLKEGGWT